MLTTMDELRREVSAAIRPLIKNWMHSSEMIRCLRLPWAMITMCVGFTTLPVANLRPSKFI